MVAMMQAIVDKIVSAKFESFYFEIRLHQTLHGVVPSLLYLVKVSIAFLNTGDFLEPVAYLVKAEAGMIMDVSLKRKE